MYKDFKNKAEQQHMFLSFSSKLQLELEPEPDLQTGCDSATLLTLNPLYFILPCFAEAPPLPQC